ncbi:MAG TPA: nuclear transport factor 2 family protein [Actinocatenispora sp.]
MDDKTALAYRMHGAANAGDYDAMDEIFAPGFVSHPLGTTGIEPIRAGWRAIRSAYPELHSEIRDVLVDGDRVAVRAEITGTPEPATLMEIFRVEDGRVAELWGVTTLPLT